MIGSSQPSRSAAPLETALEKTEAVADDVQRASEDLAVVSTVLDQELPAEVQTGEVAQALQHTHELEKKLAQSAERLAEANETLAQELKSREGRAKG